MSVSDAFLAHLGMLRLHPTTLNLHFTNYKSAPASFDLLVRRFKTSCTIKAKSETLDIVAFVSIVHGGQVKCKNNHHKRTCLQGRDTTYIDEPEKYQILASGSNFN